MYVCTYVRMSVCMHRHGSRGQTVLPHLIPAELHFGRLCRARNTDSSQSLQLVNEELTVLGQVLQVGRQPRWKIFKVKKGLSGLWGVWARGTHAVMYRPIRSSPLPRGCSDAWTPPGVGQHRLVCFPPATRTKLAAKLPAENVHHRCRHFWW